MVVPVQIRVLTANPAQLLHRCIAYRYGRFIVTRCCRCELEIVSALLLVIPKDANHCSIRDSTAYRYLWLDEGAYG